MYIYKLHIDVIQIDQFLGVLLFKESKFAESCNVFGVVFVHFATIAFKLKRKKNLGRVSQFIYFYTFDLCLLGVSA